MREEVLVVLGGGGMGEAVVRRLGAGSTVFLGDVSHDTLARMTETLTADGFKVLSHAVDVGTRESVRAFAKAATAAGRVVRLVHTAGLSPVQAGVEALLQVDLYGVAVVLDEFEGVMAEGGAGVIIASMAGHLTGGLPREQEQALRSTPTEELLQLSFLQPAVLSHPGVAYTVAKRGVALRVGAASCRWGKRGARVNSVSPGVIATAMGREELNGPAGEHMRAMVAGSPTGRLGTPSDIADACAFLLGSGASFITGTDLLVDGGVVAALHSAQAS